MEFSDISDELRLPESMDEPDARSSIVGIHSKDVLFDKVKQYELNSVVPQHIVTQYNTARNLYLYAFHVYRFYNIAQQQLYSVLEMAIRDCIGEEELAIFIKSKTTKRKRPVKGLSIYLQYLKDNQLIKNFDFPQWQRRHSDAIEESYFESVYKYMHEHEIDEFLVDENEVMNSKPAPDFDYDYVSILCKSIPALRNHFAHGSTSLCNSVLIFFENISIIINKMYERAENG